MPPTGSPVHAATQCDEPPHSDVAHGATRPNPLAGELPDPRTVIDSLVDALIVIDTAGLISDVNRQTERLTGRRRADLVGTPFKDCFTEPQRAQDCFERVLADAKAVNQELTVNAGGCALTVVSCDASAWYGSDHRLCGVVATARDLTERKRADHVLDSAHGELNSAKLAAELASQAKSEFLSSMSHELRSPLNAILGFAQLLDTGEPPPTPLQKDSVDQILHAGWYLLELINEILDLSLIESGKLTLSFEPVALAELLLDCHSMIEPHARSSGVGVVFAVPEAPLIVRADRTRLKQVLINLLSNAIKYNRPGGTVEVTSECGEGGHVRVSVRDTGLGLSPSQLSQLFQPFNRLGQEAGAEEGTGIGLVVCKRLTEIMGGSIGASSTVGEGSTFWVELDASASNAEAAEAAEAVDAIMPAAGLERAVGTPVRTVLYVEDNPANLLLVSRLLARRTDLQLICAKDGRSGIELARAAQPQVILMDINLPGISGLTALHILARDPDTAHIPVLALSANAMPRDIDKGLAAGFFCYLTKPIKLDEFTQALDQALDHSQALAHRPQAKPTEAD